MGLLSTANLVTILDELIYANAQMDGDGATYGIGETGDAWGAQDSIADAIAVITGSADEDVQSDLVGAFRSLATKCTASQVTKTQFRGVLGALNRHLLREGSGNFTDIESALDYLNVGTGTKWQSLMHPRWRTIWNLFKGGSTYPSRHNLYFEVLASVYANGLRKLVVGTGQTAGQDIASSYAGGFPKLLVSGFAGTSGVVTVTGTEYNPATEVATAGKTWTATVTGDGTFTMAVGTAATDSLILAASSISAAGSITAPTSIILEAHRPTGRPLIPA
jgi:hypothetical protein